MIFQSVFKIISDIIFNIQGIFAGSYFKNVIDSKLGYLFTLLPIALYILKIQ